MEFQLFIKYYSAEYLLLASIALKNTGLVDNFS